ncbi:MAG: 2,3-bisphosphoglycerate-independent phosphoglycerate mutase [Candidatus Doudnabacteria bacterium]|nr:2,3-bisphosphoglycerate-independent phosphoglycerate mutase [Candidatus Doudnabacteria bacterium]
MTLARQLVVLAVLDGWGIAPAGPGNAISLAKKPNFDLLQKSFSASELLCSGQSVGLKEGEPGNSEAGHENMGAGRTVKQDKVYILDSIHDGTFFKNAAFIEALNHAKKNKSNIHLMGLLSDGRTGHTEPDHLEALLVFFKKYSFDRVFLHLFTDGRDTPQKSAKQFLQRLQLTMDNLEVGNIASVSGRYFGMDRAHNYQRLLRAYQAIAFGKGRIAENAYQAIQQGYQRGETDEFLSPTVIPYRAKTGKKSVVTLADGDAVIFFNLRSDRARQMTKAFVKPGLLSDDPAFVEAFKKYKKLFFVTMTEFGTELPVIVAYPSREVYNSLPFYLEKFQHFHQLYISESEKFAHVTYFFHGNNSRVCHNEKRVRVDSKRVVTFDLAPEMSAKEITDALILHLRKKLYNFCLVNYPNADMLGHTGNLKATVSAVAAIDQSIGRLWEEVKNQNGVLIVTADHGNAENMLDPLTGEINHEHSLNPVPFIVADQALANRKSILRNGSLRDIAPTILDLFGLPKPSEMLGISLLKDLRSAKVERVEYLSV